VQLIDTAQVVDGEVLDIDAGGGESGQDPRLQVHPAIVLSNQICDVHHDPLGGEPSLLRMAVRPRWCGL
jgi:hypothetical protein